MSHYLPTLCDCCWRVSLTALGAFGANAQPCAACGEPVRVVPSCSYKQSDLLLFTELSQIVSDGGVEPDEAEALSAEIVRALGTGSLKACCDIVAVRLPGLLPLQLVTGSNVTGHRSALRILKTIFEALATLRRTSVIRSVERTREATRRLA